MYIVWLLCVSLLLQKAVSSSVVPVKSVPSPTVLSPPKVPPVTSKACTELTQTAAGDGVTTIGDGSGFTVIVTVPIVTQPETASVAVTV